MSRWLVTGSAGMLGQDLVAVLVAAGHEVDPGPSGRARRHRPAGLPGRGARARRRRQRRRLDRRRRRRDARGAGVRGQRHRGGERGPRVRRGRCAARAGLHRLRVRRRRHAARTPRTPPRRRGRRTGGPRRPASGPSAALPAAAGSCGPRGCTAAAAPTSSRRWPGSPASATRSRSWTTSAVSRRGPWTCPRGRAAGRRGAPRSALPRHEPGETTWYGFTREIFAGLGLDPERVRPRRRDGVPLPAPRPAYSVLGHDAWRMARHRPGCRTGARAWRWLCPTWSSS